MNLHFTVGWNFLQSYMYWDYIKKIIARNYATVTPSVILNIFCTHYTVNAYDERLIFVDDTHRADFRFAHSQWETVLFCNDVSHWLGASIKSALCLLVNTKFVLICVGRDNWCRNNVSMSLHSCDIPDGKELLIHSQTSTMQLLKFAKIYVISSRTSLGMWLLLNRPVSQLQAPSGGLSRTSRKLWQDYSSCYMFWT